MAVLTISRMYGCGARELARELVATLGYYLFEKEIIPAMAKRLDRKADAARKHELTDVQPPPLAGDLVSFRLAVLQKNGITPSEYTEALRDLFLQMAQKGNLIIIGRGSQFILQNQPGVFHLRLVANIEDRINHIKTQHLLRLSEVDPAQKVKREDRRRREFLKTHFQQDGDDPLLYHLTINLSKVSLAKTQEIILNLIS